MYPVGAATKKRRLQGACDLCRSKKVRCDSATMPGNVCSNCISFGSTCTHTMGKRGKPIAYAAGQPAALDIHQNLWENETYREISSKANAILGSSNTAAFRDDAKVTLEFAQYIAALEKELASKRPEASESPSTAHRELSRSSDADGLLADHLKLMSIDSSEDSHLRFYGKSSGIMLLKAALDLKKSTEFYAQRRPEFWSIYHWQLPKEGSPNLQFPEKDLMNQLIDLYFIHVNIFIPILHGPSFRESVNANLHRENYHFVSYEQSRPEQSSGWQWFEQVRPVQPTLLVYPPTIEELQYYCLSALYLYGTSTYESSWTIIGLAVRLAQQIGLHRRVGKQPTEKGETLKRVFWAIVALDILSSVYLGRPKAIQPEDFDQDLPVECDDEYWNTSDPEQAFKQPENQPSTMAYWNSYVKLLGILGRAQRMVYSIQRSDHYSQIAAQLDNALDKWSEFVPEHLRWGIEHRSDVFYNQSASLYTAYYYVRILVHRPSVLGSQPMSLAICVKAARKCIQVMDHQAQKGFSWFPHLHAALFTSAVVLIIDSWLTPLEAERNRVEASKCLRILHLHETRRVALLERLLPITDRLDRWQIAGRLSDLIQGLLQLEGSEVKQRSPRPSKRRRETQEPQSSVVDEKTYPSDEFQGFDNAVEPDLTPFAAESHSQSPLFSQAEMQRYFYQPPYLGWNEQFLAGVGTQNYPDWAYQEQRQDDNSLYDWESK